MGRQRNNPASPGGMLAGEDADRAPRNGKAGRTAGRPSRPVRLPCGLEIGGGAVHPEFPIRLREGTPDAAASCAAEAEALLRAAAGRVQGAVFDLDLAPAPAVEGWLAALRTLRDILARARRDHGLPAALRVTFKEPGEVLRQAVEAGAAIINLESHAGLDLFEHSLQACEVRGLVLACGVVAAEAVARDWEQLQALLEGTGAVGGGHSARPFLQSALRHAKSGTAPEVMCAVGVAACAVPTLVSCEVGASGPAREGAWEGVVVKAIRGCPVSLGPAFPGSPALAAMADLWHGDAVEETLAACEALGQGRPWPGAGEARGAVARILSEGGIESLADAIQTCQKPYQRAIAAAYAAVTLLAEDWEGGGLSEEGRALLGRLEEQLLLLPESGQVLLDHFRGETVNRTPSGEMHR